MDATRLPPPEAAAPPVAAPSEASATVFDGGPTAIAGRYLVDSKHTRTVTGVYAEAHDTKGDGAAIGFKLVPPEVLPNPALVERALRELKQLAKTHSDKILKVLDQGKLDDGRIYIATEKAPATTLEAVLAEGPMAVERACKIVLQIGEALAEAQKVGVIHRDVCPRVVFLGPGDQVKVGDFGLAEPVNDKVFGAPAYISPEQIEGRPVDQRSNIYNLGALLYHALTGAPPYSGDAASVMQQHQTAGYPPASAKRPDLPSDVDRVLQKALEKSAGRRHLTLRQLLSEVEMVAGQKPLNKPAPRPVAATVMGMPLMAPTPANPAMAVVPPSLTPAVVAPPNAMTTPAMSAAAPATTPDMPAVKPSTLPDLPVAAVAAAAVALPRPPEPKPEPKPEVVVGGKPLNAPAQVQAAVAAAQAAKQHAQQQQAQAQAQAGGKKGGFRETAWFKAGELQEEFNKAAAEAAESSGNDPLGRSGVTGSHVAVDGEVDSSKIDVSSEDKARLSLKTGATQAMAVIKAPPVAVPGDQMSEQEMLAELDSSKKWFVIAGIAVAVVVLAVVLWFVLGKKEGPAPKADAPGTKPDAVAAAPPAGPTPTVTPPPTTPSAPPTTPPPTTPATPTPGAEPLAAGEASLAAGDFAAAIDSYHAARAVGAAGKSLKHLEAGLQKALTKRAVTAKKKKDKAGEAEARALLAKLKHKK